MYCTLELAKWFTGMVSQKSSHLLSFVARNLITLNNILASYYTLLVLVSLFIKGLRKNEIYYTLA